MGMLYLTSFLIFGIARVYGSSRTIPYPIFDPLEATRRGLEALPTHLEAARFDVYPVPNGEMQRRLQNDADEWQRRREWIRSSNGMSNDAGELLRRAVIPASHNPTLIRGD